MTIRWGVLSRGAALAVLMVLGLAPGHADAGGRAAKPAISREGRQSVAIHFTHALLQNQPTDRHVDLKGALAKPTARRQLNRMIDMAAEGHGPIRLNDFETGLEISSPSVRRELHSFGDAKTIVTSPTGRTFTTERLPFDGSTRVNESYTLGRKGASRTVKAAIREHEALHGEPLNDAPKAGDHVLVQRDGRSASRVIVARDLPQGGRRLVLNVQMPPQDK